MVLSVIEPFLMTLEIVNINLCVTSKLPIIKNELPVTIDDKFLK